MGILPTKTSWKSGRRDSVIEVVSRISGNVALAVVFTVLGLLLFYRLGVYSLWDDEAEQCLFAEQVWRTGDTSALVAPNIIAYNGGEELVNLHGRADPPLMAYIIAPFVGLCGRSPFWVRFPGALFGLAYCALILLWVRRAGADRTTSALFCIGLLGDVALILFSRQARYYSLVLFCSLAIGYLYLARPRSARTLVGISLLQFCLLASHTITYAGVTSVLVVDYLAWKRRSEPLTGREWFMLLAPQVVLGVLLLSIWNPFYTRVGAYEFANSAGRRAELFWWNLRDLNRGEFGAGILLLAAPFLGSRDVSGGFLRRGVMAIIVYSAVIALVSPQLINQPTLVANVRYMLPLLPIALALSVLTLRSLAGNRLWLALPLGIVSFHTNLLNFGPLLPEGVRSTTVDLIGELNNPPRGPYGVCAQWINDHVPPGSSIWVNPRYAVFPLMFHAPKATYAWQLQSPVDPQFRGLPAIHFFGEVPPDYMVSFGPYVDDTRQIIEQGRKLGFLYEPVATIEQYWGTVHRPGLLSHHFKSVTDFDRDKDVIHVFHRVFHGR